MNRVIYDHLAGRVPLMVTGGVNTADKAMEALEIADMTAVATPLLTDPEFFIKIKESREDEIDLTINGEESLKDLAIPRAAFKDIAYLLDVGSSLSSQTRDELRSLQYNYED